MFYLPFKKVRTGRGRVTGWSTPCLGLVLVPLVLAFGTSPNVCSVLKAAPRRRIALLLPVRRDVGRGRADVGIDDPLPRRRSGPGHRLRHLLRRRAPWSRRCSAGDSASSSSRARASCPSSACSFRSSASSSSAWRACRRRRNCPRRRRRRPWRSSTSRRASWRRLLRPDEFGHGLRPAWAAPRSRQLAVTTAPVTVADLERHARAGGGAARRLRRSTASGACF